MMIEEKMEMGKKPDLSKGHETILLVDDEPSLLETGQELLSFLGYNVLTASSGENALVTIKREGGRISIVIMDLMMPGMGGEKMPRGNTEDLSLDEGDDCKREHDQCKNRRHPQRRGHGLHSETILY